jgi:hypothetical protein
MLICYFLALFGPSECFHVLQQEANRTHIKTPPHSGVDSLPRIKVA